MNTPETKSKDSPQSTMRSVLHWVAWFVGFVAAAAAIVGITFSAVFSYTNYRTAQDQQRTAFQALLASRYVAALDSFSAADLSRKVGGIYELHQLAITEPRYRASVMEMLEAFIRQSSPNPGPNKDGTSYCVDDLAWDKGYRAADHGLLADAQKLALSVVVDLSLRPGPVEHRIKLNNACLFRVDLEGANLTNADFGGSDLQGAHFANAIIDGGLMEYTQLQYADFTGTSLHNAKLNFASMHCVGGTPATLEGAKMASVADSTTAQWPMETVKAAINVPKEFGKDAKQPCPDQSKPLRP